MAATVVAYIGLGSNLADPRAQIERAFDELARMPGSTLLARSSAWASAPWGRTDQPEFVNAAAAVATALSAEDLLRALLDIERRGGRERGSERWGPRTIDLDVLAYADRRIDLPGLQVPHPHLHERAFVLLPLAEIAPDLEIPGRGRIADLAVHVDAAGVRRLDA